MCMDLKNLKWFLVPAALMGCVILGMRWEAASQKDGKALWLEKHSVDLGDLIQGDKKQIELEVRNTSFSRLTIARIDKSCGCTQAEVLPEVLEPGQSGRLKLNVATEKAADFTETHVSIVYQVGKRKLEYSVSLNVSCNVLVPIAFEPAVLDLGVIDKEKTKGPVRGVVQARREPSSWRWDSIAGRMQGSKVEVKPAESDSYRIEAFIDPAQLPTGELKETIWVDLSSQEGSKSFAFRIPVKATVTSSISTQPKSLYFGTIQKGEEATLTLRLRDAKSPLQFISVQNDLPPYVLLKQEADGDGGLTFSCTVKHPGNFGNLSKVLSLKVRKGNVEEKVVVPLLAYAAGV